MSDHQYSFLDRVNTPEDVRALQVAELKGLCKDVREFLIEVVSKTGGHLGAGLGAVELSVALHYAFNTPHDKLVWDVGHQAYPHKILTGRKDRLHTIRQYKGLSGFLKRSESPYDTFGAGHASTAISAAVGMVAARELLKETYKVIAVVGDGSMTGGMVYEGMNNAGLMKKDLIVVLNDNNMSIASKRLGNLELLHRVDCQSTVQPVQAQCVRADRQAGGVGRPSSEGGRARRGRNQGYHHPGHALRGPGFSVLRADQRPQYHTARPDIPRSQRIQRADSCPHRHAEG